MRFRTAAPSRSVAATTATSRSTMASIYRHDRERRQRGARAGPRLLFALEAGEEEEPAVHADHPRRRISGARSGRDCRSRPPETAAGSPVPTPAVGTGASSPVSGARLSLAFAGTPMHRIRSAIATGPGEGVDPRVGPSTDVDALGDAAALATRVSVDARGIARFDGVDRAGSLASCERGRLADWAALALHVAQRSRNVQGARAGSRAPSRREARSPQALTSTRPRRSRPRNGADDRATSNPTRTAPSGRRPRDRRARRRARLPPRGRRS